MALMDKAGRKKGGKKGDFASKALENDKVREMQFHMISMEELEKKLDTNIKDVSSNRLTAIEKGSY